MSTPTPTNFAQPKKSSTRLYPVFKERFDSMEPKKSKDKKKNEEKEKKAAMTLVGALQQLNIMRLPAVDPLVTPDPDMQRRSHPMKDPVDPFLEEAELAKQRPYEIKDDN